MKVLLHLITLLTLGPASDSALAGLAYGHFQNAVITHNLKGAVSAMREANKNLSDKVLIQGILKKGLIQGIASMISTSANEYYDGEVETLHKDLPNCLGKGLTELEGVALLWYTEGGYLGVNRIFNSTDEKFIAFGFPRLSCWSQRYRSCHPFKVKSTEQQITQRTYQVLSRDIW